MSDQVPHFPLRPLQPGGYSTLDTAALANASQAPGKPVVAVLGDCKGGKPNTPLRFSSPQALRSVMRSGEALDVARTVALAAAAAGGGGPIVGVRVGNAIAQATLNLAGATGTPIKLRSIDYGAWTTGIRATVAANNKVSIAYTDALGLTYTETWALGGAATKQDILDAINGKKAGFAKSAYVTAEDNGVGTFPLATLAQTTLTGGADSGTIVSGDWTTALAALEAVDVDIIVVASGDATVHAQVKAHCDLMSSVLARKERTAVLGGVLGETGTQAAARAAALAANRCQLVWPGGSLYDDAGTLTQYPPYIIAGGIAGEHSALPDQATSLVHRRLNWLVDVEKALSTMPGGELDTALAGGVTPVNVADGGGNWVVDSLSTNMAVRQLADFHKIRTADAVSKYMRQRLEGLFVGRKALEGIAQSIFNDATQGLDFLVRTELIRAAGVIDVQSDPDDPRAYLIQLPVVLPDTTKFVLLTVALRPPGVTTAAAA